MSDYEYLQQLEVRMNDLLSERKRCVRDFPRRCSKASFRRLRLELQSLMLKIEKSMEPYSKYGVSRERWE